MRCGNQGWGLLREGDVVRAIVTGCPIHTRCRNDSGGNGVEGHQRPVLFGASRDLVQCDT